jgi:hypothetical protein
MDIISKLTVSMPVLCEIAHHCLCADFEIPYIPEKGKYSLGAYTVVRC